MTAVTKARVFQSGNSQAVRLPKEFRFRSPSVEIFRRGDEIVLREPPRDLSEVFHLLTKLSAGFMKGGRRQPRPQKRASF
jgi:antitoxin VapB